MKRLLLTLCIGSATFSYSQCDSVAILSNLHVISDTTMSGIYNIQGSFTVDAGATITLTPYTSTGCGALKIYANSISIQGNINGDYAGFPGGNGGLKGATVTSSTGNAASLTACGAASDEGQITIQGGQAALNGSGPGAGHAGSAGTNGSGTKQYCGSVGDDAGFVAGSGGSGGGAGASYGGLGSNGNVGGSGSSTIAATDATVSAAYAKTAGIGGNGGTITTLYGTENGTDIDLGSGGAGAGAGGRSFTLGTDGGKGGNGGGMVFLRAANSLTITGVISVKGQNGANGGNGGNGDATADCCSDGCSGCDERTFSAGSGAGAGAGAGSGGGIYIEALGTATITGELNAKGGNGGESGIKGNGTTCDYDGGFVCGTQTVTTGSGTVGTKGGAGGGGRIKLFLAKCDQTSINPLTDVSAGTGNGSAGAGTYYEECGNLGLETLTSDLNWTIYPNPTTDFVQVILHADQVDGSEKSIRVINSLGMIVSETTMSGSKQLIDMQGLNAGFYTVSLEVNGVTAHKYLIKK